MSIKEFKDLELAKAALYSMLKVNEMDNMAEELSEEVVETVAKRVHKIAESLEDYDMEHQRNYLFTIMSLLMLELESITENSIGE